MKKSLSVILVILLLLVTSGCTEETPLGPVVYEKPTFTPGVLETELLTAEPGNFDRMGDTGTGKYLEIDSGYYANWWGYLYYAEKTDLDTWYYVCSDPDCGHGNGCSSFIQSNTVWYNDEKIYFSADTAPWAHIRGDSNGFVALMHMEENGANVQMVNAYNFFPNGGYAVSHEAIPGGGLFGAEALRPDGRYDYVVYLYTLDKGLQTLHEEVVDEAHGRIETKCGVHLLRLGGDLSVLSAMFTDGLYENTLCWFQNEEPVFTDISEIPAWGGYLQDNVIRCFYPGDGYYDVDLLTGERTKLADTQLENSKAQILQPNCIIETTLLNPEANVETQEMRFYDGQQWHAVELPEELLTPDGMFQVVALASDRIIFYIGRSNGSNPENASIIFYEMKLEAETYTVEYMGTFQKPTGTSLADQS